jgi:hypothetical protein
MTARPTSDLTQWGTSATITQPSAPEVATGFVPNDKVPAQWFNYFLNNLAKWSSYLDTEKLRSIVHTDSGIPVIGVPTGSSAHDHPGNTANRWKLVLRVPLSVGGYTRLYVGEGAVNDLSAWCVTVNASWNPANSGAGGQNWVKDDTSKESSLLRCYFGGLQFYGRIAGAGSWGDTAWDAGRGTLSVGYAIAATTISTTAALTVGNGMTVTGTAHFNNAVDVGGGLDVEGGDFRVILGNCAVKGNYTYYGSAPLREIVGTMAGGDCINNFEYVGATETISTTGDAGSAIYTKPIYLPTGALIHEVLVQGHRNTSTLLVKLNRWVQSDWAAAPAAGQSFNIGQTSISSTTLATTTAACGDYPVNNAVEAYTLQVTCSTSSATGDVMERYKIRFYDPGPRNF